MLDPFGGALSTALACLQVNRSCISLTNNCADARFAKSRLRIFATMSATLQDLGTYSDPIDVDSLEKGDDNINPQMSSKSRKSNRELCVVQDNSLAKRRKTGDVDDGEENSDIDVEQYPGEILDDVEEFEEAQKEENFKNDDPNKSNGSTTQELDGAESLLNLSR